MDATRVSKIEALCNWNDFMGVISKFVGAKSANEVSNGQKYWVWIWKVKLLLRKKITEK
jgi:hypothetical protein